LLALSAIAALPCIAAAQTPPATTARWVNGHAVNLRSEPSLTAPVTARMKLNTPVELLLTRPTPSSTA
jgi:hypothetical protein